MTEVEEIQQMKEKCIAMIMEGIISDSVEEGCGAISIMCSIAERAKIAIRDKDMAYMAYKTLQEELKQLQG